ncbi:MAG: PEP-CTERM sorting domain-containing protein [Proteobacteria bacterium]|nr:PEP-CTERM sorting domain-containing protein [Pseudomonadota bacterium]
MTWVALDYTGGVFSVYASGMNGSDDPNDPNGGFLPDAQIASGLAAGQWYRLDQMINFVDSPNGGDDQVRYTLFDAGGNQVGTTLTTSWDDGYLGSDRFYPGATLKPVDQLNFRTAFTTPGTGFYIDDVSYSAGNATAAVPEPATWAMMIMGFGLMGYSMRRRRAVLATA